MHAVSPRSLRLTQVPYSAHDSAYQVKLEFEEAGKRLHTLPGCKNLKDRKARKSNGVGPDAEPSTDQLQPNAVELLPKSLQAWEPLAPSYQYLANRA